MAFLLIYILCSLAVAEKYKRVDDDSRTGLQADGAVDETFCQRTNANGLLFLEGHLFMRCICKRNTC